MQYKFGFSVLSGLLMSISAFAGDYTCSSKTRESDGYRMILTLADLGAGPQLMIQEESDDAFFGPIVVTDLRLSESRQAMTLMSDDGKVSLLLDKEALAAVIPPLYGAVLTIEGAKTKLTCVERLY